MRLLRMHPSINNDHYKWADYDYNGALPKLWLERADCTEVQ